MNRNPPNIILIITDQQRYDTIQALGYPHMNTPNLNRLVKEGVSFDNCFVAAPSCAPARASFFTGTYPHTTGIFKNADSWKHTWVESLANSGYYCVNVGKMHTYPYFTPAGFHERFVVENKDRFLEERWTFDELDKAFASHQLVKPQRSLYRKRHDYREALGAFPWSAPDHLHPDHFVGNLATWWLENKPVPDQPLFLQIGFPGPHPPYDPPQSYADEYLGKDLPLAEVSPEDLSGQPEVFQKLRQHNFDVDHDSVVHLPDPSPQQRRHQRAHYLGNVTLIDEQVGAILDTLERRGYLENAVVIFTSDHGDCLTDHGHSQKWTMYDTVTRVPALVWSPNRFQGNRRIENLYQWFDFAPTILELAGVPIPDWMEGISLLPELNGDPGARGRSVVFAEHGRDGILDSTDMMLMVRDTRWKLVHFIDYADGQLFDLRSDPEETVNLWDDPEYQGEKQRLLEEERRWLLESQIRSRTWAADFR